MVVKLAGRKSGTAGARGKLCRRCPHRLWQEMLPSPLFALQLGWGQKLPASPQQSYLDLSKDALGKVIPTYILAQLSQPPSPI